MIIKNNREDEKLMSNQRQHTINYDAIPAELKGINQWVAWKLIIENKDSKPKKVPFNPKTDKPAQTNNPQTWGAYQEAMNYTQRNNDAGMGFVFKIDTGIVGVDIDNCVNENGELSSTAEEIIKVLNSYTEFSPSGKGVHILLKGNLPDGARKKSEFGLEMYNTKRYFTVTGNHFNGTPIIVEERQEQLNQVYYRYMAVQHSDKKQLQKLPDRFDIALIEKAKSAKNGEKFTRLWEGNTADYNNDHSRADMALCSMLAFWTDKDAKKIDVLFRQSKLYRGKWDEIHYANGRTYGEEIIDQVIDIEAEVCDQDMEEDEYTAWRKLFQYTSYTIDKHGYLCKTKYTKSGVETVRLANFTAKIIKEIIKDDGNSSQTMFEIAGILAGGRMLQKINILSSKFSSMSWPVEYWGAAANLTPGVSNKDNMRHAIQHTGLNCIRENIFTHTGWRQVSGNWVYLHGGGAIGADNIKVDLKEARLTDYSLPQVDNIQEAAKATLDCLELAPPEITYPLLSMIFLAPLCEPMKQANCEPSFILWLSGMTGVRKSTLTGLFLSHFGSFSGKALPGSFKDTENALERKAFLLKDSVFCVDDYHPVGTAVEKKIIEKKAHSLIRGYGDRVGRIRMNPDTSLRESYPPRGLCIITGEDTPDLGQSASARLLSIELQKNAVNLSKLTELQGRVGLLAQTMTGYIEWLRTKMTDVSNKCRELFPTLRAEAVRASTHGRIPEAIAVLYLGANVLFTYLEHIGVISETDMEAELKKTWGIFMTLASSQSRCISEGAPAEKFIHALQELITTEKVLIRDIADSCSGSHTLGVEHIGWQDEQYYYLLPKITYRLVYQFYQQQGSIFAITENTLWKSLASAGKIRIKEDSKQLRRTFKKWISGIGKEQTVLHLKRVGYEEGHQ